MIRLITIFMLLALQAHALELPNKAPVAGLTCTYEGIFPGTTTRSQWTFSAAEGGRYQLVLHEPDILLGIMKMRLGDTVARVSSGVFHGKTTNGQVLSVDRYQLKALVNRTNGGVLAITNTVVEETICKERPQSIEVGDTWSCEERVQDDWSWEGRGQDSDSGSQRTSRRVQFRYERDERITVQELGTFDTAVILRVEGEGRRERHWLERSAPECPIKIERLKAGHVVGTDHLVKRAVRTNEVVSDGASREEDKRSSKPLSQDGSSQWLLVLIASVGLVSGLWIGNWYRNRSL